MIWLLSIFHLKGWCGWDLLKILRLKFFRHPALFSLLSPPQGCVGGDNNLAWPLKIIGFDFVAYDNLGHNQISTPDLE